MGHNNPSKLAYDEVVELHYGKEEGISFPLRVLVNIGTGGHPPKTQNIRETRNTRQHFRYFRLLRHAVHRLPDGSKIPDDMRRLVGDAQFNYHCLDVQHGLHTMDLDEWKKNNKTLVDIARHTDTYLDSPEAQTTLNDAAKQLVDARLAREHYWSAEKRSVIIQNSMYSLYF
jgi:hypothetical protein